MTDTNNKDTAHRCKRWRFPKKLSLSTAINFFALILLFTAVFLLQRYGQDLFPSAPDDIAKAEKIELPARPVEEENPQEVPPQSETLDPPANPSTEESAIQPTKREDLAKTNRTAKSWAKITLEEVPVEELDSEEARQNYLAGNKKVSAKTPSTPEGDFIPFERK